MGQGNLWRCQDALFGLHTKPAVYEARWLTACLSCVVLGLSAWQSVPHIQDRHQHTRLVVALALVSLVLPRALGQCQADAASRAQFAVCAAGLVALPVAAGVSGCGGFPMDE